jgi:protein SCO1/2
MAKKISLKFSIMMTAVVLAAILSGAWLTAAYLQSGSRAIFLPDRVMTLFPAPKPLAAFAFTDHENRVFDLPRLKGKWSFLFFGYTHCPDICPTTLAALARVRESIAKSTAGAQDVQFVFISVDPNRDTAGRLGQYVTYFDATFLGVTGDDAQLGNLAGQLDAAYQVEVKPGMENYPVYHTAAVFLVDPRARYHAVFAPPFDAEGISRRFEVLRALEAPKAT